MKATIVLLPGDGIGPEVISSAHRVLAQIAKLRGHTFEFQEHKIGGIAIDLFGDPLPEETIEACKSSDAVLLGAVGGPKWDDPNAKTRPEAGLLKIRKELGLFANLRPIVTFPELLDSSPLKRHIIEGTDILFFRELTGGLYFGPSGCETLPDGQQRAYSTAVYTTHEVERIVPIVAACVRENHARRVS